MSIPFERCAGRSGFAWVLVHVEVGRRFLELRTPELLFCQQRREMSIPFDRCAGRSGFAPILEVSTDSARVGRCTANHRATGKMAGDFDSLFISLSLPLSLSLFLSLSIYIYISLNSSTFLLAIYIHVFILYVHMHKHLFSPVLAGVALLEASTDVECQFHMSAVLAESSVGRCGDATPVLGAPHARRCWSCRFFLSLSLFLSFILSFSLSFSLSFFLSFSHSRSQCIWLGWRRGFARCRHEILFVQYLYWITSVYYKSFFFCWKYECNHWTNVKLVLWLPHN